MSVILFALMLVISCSDHVNEVQGSNSLFFMDYETLPVRPGPRPETTPSIPHVQTNLGLVADIKEAMVKRVFSIPGIEEQPSVVLSWQGLWLKKDLSILHPQALLSDREFGHIHDDGSLHIFLDPNRAKEAVEAGWAIDHPFALQGDQRWDGFVMLYTPQTIDELNVVFQLIVDSFNYVTGQNLVAKDYY